MRHLPFVSLIFCLLTAISINCCFGAPLVHHTIAASGMLAQIDSLVINPLVSLIVICAGMSLIMYQAADKKPYGVIGIAGLTLTGIVYYAWILSGASSWTGILISAAGVIMMYVESRIIPGHGLFAVIGAASIFAGTYLVFGGSQNGVFYPILTAIIVSGSSVIAFIVHLPNNAAWKELQKQIEYDRSMQANSIKIDTRRLKTSVRQKSSVQIQEQNGKIESALGKSCKTTSTPSIQSTETIESLRMKLAEIETYAIPIIAKQRRIEYKIKKSTEKLAKMSTEAQKAVKNDDDNLAAEVLLGIETCRISIADLEEQLDTVKLHADAALLHIEQFQKALSELSAKTLNIESKECIRLMQAQFKQMTSEDMKVIDEMDERADAACSEADILESMSDEGSNHQHMKMQLADRKTRADKALIDLKIQIHGSDTSSDTPNQDSQQQKLGHD